MAIAGRRKDPFSRNPAGMRQGRTTENIHIDADCPYASSCDIIRVANTIRSTALPHPSGIAAKRANALNLAAGSTRLSNSNRR